MKRPFLAGFATLLVLGVAWAQAPATPPIASGGGGLTSPVGIPDGGTGATSAAAARVALGAATSGANGDITALTGLTTPLAVARGGTGASDVATARTNLGIPPRIWPTRRLVAGTWEPPAGATASPGNSTLAANTITLVPIDLTETATIGRIGWFMSAAAGQATNVRYGLYTDDGVGMTFTLVPNSDLGDVAVASGAASGNILSATMTLQQPPGRYYLAQNVSASLSGSVSVAATQALDLPWLDLPGSAAGVPVGFRIAATYGPMPATITAPTRAGAGSQPRIAYPAAYVASTP